MSELPVRTRDSMGRWLKGQSANTKGRLPRQTETKYLEATMGSCSVEEWAEIILIAVEDARDTDATPHVRARAREWLAKYLIGEPSQLHQLLYKEERKFEIVVTFGDNGNKALPAEVEDVIEGIIVDEERPMGG
jgi:hypothetical protein